MIVKQQHRTTVLRVDHNHLAIFVRIVMGMDSCGTCLNTLADCIYSGSNFIISLCRRVRLLRNHLGANDDDVFASRQDVIICESALTSIGVG